MSPIKDVFSSNMKKPKANVSKEKPDNKRKETPMQTENSSLQKTAVPLQHWQIVFTHGVFPPVYLHAM